MPMKQILVIAAPESLQEGLQALLATLPHTELMLVADVRAAQAQMAQQGPHLVIIAGRQAVESLAALAEQCSASRFLLLVQHARDKAAAEAAGADVVLVEGVPAGQLLDVAHHLLAEASTTHMEV